MSDEQFQEMWSTHVVPSQRIPSVVRETQWEWEINTTNGGSGGGHWLLFYADPEAQDLDWTRLCDALARDPAFAAVSALRTTTKAWRDFHAGRDGMIHVHVGPPGDQRQCEMVGRVVHRIASARSHGTITYKPDEPFSQVLYRVAASADEPVQDPSGSGEDAAAAPVVIAAA